MKYEIYVFAAGAAALGKSCESCSPFFKTSHAPVISFIATMCSDEYSQNFGSPHAYGYWVFFAQQNTCDA
jgi:hypothetical protein